MIKQFAGAAVALMMTGNAMGNTWGLPGPGGHDGLGLPLTIWRSEGAIPVESGSTIVGMYDETKGYRSHFVTASDPYAVYEAKCNSSVYNDTPGGRAHAEAIVWWKAALGNIEYGTQLTPHKGGYRTSDGIYLPLPRPPSINMMLTGGQTVANTGAPWESPIIEGEEPWRPIEVHGLIFGVGHVPEEQGGVLPSTKYNVDWVARAVVRGSMYILGTTCYVIRVQ